MSAVPKQMFNCFRFLLGKVTQITTSYITFEQPAIGYYSSGQNFIIEKL